MTRYGTAPTGTFELPAHKGRGTFTGLGETEDSLTGLPPGGYDPAAEESGGDV